MCADFKIDVCPRHFIPSRTHSLTVQKGWTPQMQVGQCLGYSMARNVSFWRKRCPVIIPGWWFRFGTCFIFPYVGNNHPNWLSCFSEGLKPPTSNTLWPLKHIETTHFSLSHPLMDEKCQSHGSMFVAKTSYHGSFLISAGYVARFASNYFINSKTSFFAVSTQFFAGKQPSSLRFTSSFSLQKKSSNARPF